MSIAVGRVILEFCFEFLHVGRKKRISRNILFETLFYTDDFLLLAKKTMWFLILCLRDKSGTAHGARASRVLRAAGCGGREGRQQPRRKGVALARSVRA